MTGAIDRDDDGEKARGEGEIMYHVPEDAPWVVMESGVEGNEPEAVPLVTRTRDFALRTIRLCGALPKSMAADVIGRQLLRSGTSVGAHYREAVRARSDAEIISKLEAGLQELEETRYWIELLIGAGIVSERRLASLYAESDELAAILVTCVKRIKSRKSSHP